MISLLAPAVLVLAGCGPAATPDLPPTREATPTRVATATPSPEPSRVADGLGRTVEFAAPFRRIISIAPSNTEILFAIGAGANLVGRSDQSDYPPQAEAVPSIGDVYAGLNLESVVALEPDLVLAADITPPEQIQALEDLGIAVFAVGNPTDFEALFDNIRLVGALTGREAEAASQASDLRARVDAVVAALEGVDPVTLFYEVDGTDPAAPWTTGRGTFQQVLFDVARAQNVASDIQGWGQITLEELVSRDPDVIVFGSGPFIPTTVDSLRARPGWAGISAVASGQVYSIDTDWTDLPGPRLVDALEAIARILHPEAFGP
jgi:iron complex transport system substrate-binding protein